MSPSQTPIILLLFCAMSSNIAEKKEKKTHFHHYDMQSLKEGGGRVRG